MALIETRSPVLSADATRVRFGAADVVNAFVAATMLALLYRLFTRHTLWYDEAMLLTNVTQGTWRDLFGPLPFYDQAAPQLYVLLLKTLYTLFGLNEVLFRLPSWIAGAAAVWIMAQRMPGLSALERACAAAMLAGGYTFAYLTMEAKQYQFEVLCSVVLMAFFQGAPASLRVTLARLGFLLVAIVSASTLPLALFAVGVVDHLKGVRSPSEAVRVIPDRIAAGGWIYAVAALVYVIYYAAHIQPAYQAVLGNFGYTYESFGYVRKWSYPVWLVYKVWDIIESHFAIFGALILPAVAYGAWRLRGRGTAYPAQAGVLVGVMVLLNAAGLFPLLPARFSVFMMPWLAVLGGAAVAALLARIKDTGMQMLGAAAVTGLVMLPSLHCIADPSEHESAKSIATLRNVQGKPGAPQVMVTVSAQPVLDVYLRDGVQTAEARCLFPGVLGYTSRCRALKAAGDGAMQGIATKWYLLNYASIIGRGLEPIGFPGRDPQAFAASYNDWLASVLPVGRPVLLYTAPPTVKDTDGDPLLARLMTIAGVERVVDERVTPTTSRAGQIDRVVRKE